MKWHNELNNNKLDNLEEINNLLERHKQMKWTQE